MPRTDLCVPCCVGCVAAQPVYVSVSIYLLIDLARVFSLVCLFCAIFAPLTSDALTCPGRGAACNQEGN